ncbi:MAG: NADH-quinone oxidoreductase subunit J [Deltaproteobacteria bacterium]|nr:NADH-quinone oxidoreductase subunit J [Deltaproteobacteria bacterium]
MTSGYEITGIAAAAWLATALVTMVAAVGVAVLRNIVHAAFALLVVLLGVAGLYALAGADLIAVLQILLYVGGVVVLLLFAVMLTSRMGDPEVASQPLAPLRAALAVTSLSALLAYGLIVSTRWRDVDAPHIVGTTADVGEAFLGRYLLPFEVISVLLLAAVVGAVVIARRDSRSEREIGERRR